LSWLDFHHGPCPTFKFFELLQDNDFQDVVFAALISMKDLEGKPILKDANGNSLDIKPEQMFKDLNYYFQAQGSQSAYDQAMKSMQYGSGLGLQGLQAGLQGVQGAVGAGQYGLAGLGTAGTAASTLGALGQTQFGQDMAINQAQMQAGALQQAQEQRGLDIAYQQYQDSMNYPYKQLGFMSDIYRGLPMSQGAQSMYQNPSAISQAAGLGTAAYGAYNMFGSAKGGAIKDEESDGLDTLGMYNAMKG
jgi:hypothetical protein